MGLQSNNDDARRSKKDAWRGQGHRTFKRDMPSQMLVRSILDNLRLMDTEVGWYKVHESLRSMNRKGD